MAKQKTGDASATAPRKTGRGAPRTTGSVRFSVSLDPETYARLVEFAAGTRPRASRAAAVEFIVQEFFKRRPRLRGRAS